LASICAALSRLATPANPMVLPDAVGSMLPADKHREVGRKVGGLHPGQRADGPS
jgi:hypothetical protein